MKKITIILILIILSGCKDTEKKVIPEFTERDAYELVNELFISQLNEYDSIIYWNNRQLKSPPIEHTDIYSDEIITTQLIMEPFPRYTATFWDTNKLKGIRVITSEEFDYFFEKNDSVDLEQLWNSTYNHEYVHNVSYPIYNPETKVAIIKDYVYKPFIFCGTDLENLYYFKKTNNGWEKLY